MEATQDSVNMIDLELVEELSEAIISAGVDPRLWIRLPELIVERFPGSAAAISRYDRNQIDPIAVHTAGIDKNKLEDYFEYYRAINPQLPFWIQVPVRNAVASSPADTFPDYRETEFNTDWLRPIDKTSSVGIKLIQSETSQSLLHVSYPKNLSKHYDDRLIRLLNALRPSFRAAIEMNRHLVGSGELVRGTLQNILDISNIPSMIADQDGQILLTNRSADTLILTDGPLVEKSGKIAVRSDANCDVNLDDAIRNALSNSLTLDNRIHIRNADGKLRGLISVLPISPLETNGTAWLFGDQKRVLIMIRGFGPRNEDAPRLLAELFGLTKQETEVALRLSAGYSLTELAEALGISSHTARKHLNHVFEKTRCRRQAELVSTVLMMG